MPPHSCRLKRTQDESGANKENMQLRQTSGGARGGPGDYGPRRMHLAPVLRNFGFCGRNFANHSKAAFFPLSKASAPPLEGFWCHP